MLSLSLIYIRGLHRYLIFKYTQNISSIRKNILFLYPFVQVWLNYPKYSEGGWHVGEQVYPNFEYPKNLGVPKIQVSMRGSGSYTKLQVEARNARKLYCIAFQITELQYKN